MTREQVIARNAAVLMLGQILSWCGSLVFVLIVPRAVGDAAWGEWSLAAALSAMALAAASLGLSPLLIREISRHPERASEYIGAGLTTQLLLALPYVGIVVTISVAAGYSPHTRIIIAVIALANLVLFLVMPVTCGLQALEKMHFNSLSTILQNGLQAVTAVILVKFLGEGVTAIAFVLLITFSTSAAFQWFALSLHVRVTPRVDWTLTRRLLRGGLPFWAGGLFLSFYMWIDSVLLSVLTSTKEVGWYGAAVQLISTMGFLPYIITMAVFPALSHSFKHDRTTMAQLARRSLRILTSLALPMAIGIALVGPSLVNLLYGPQFTNSGPILVVLSATLVPMFMATLVNGFLVAVDRQVQWTVVMVVMCVINPLLNLATIPYFDHHFGNGALGASVALLVTDLLTGCAALLLLPSDLLGSMRSILPAVGKAALATGVMAVFVWPIREVFVAVPIAIGLASFTAFAIALRVFTPDDVELFRSLIAKGLDRFPRRKPAVAPAAVEAEIG